MILGALMSVVSILSAPLVIRVDDDVHPTPTLNYSLPYSNSYTFANSLYETNLTLDNFTGNTYGYSFNLTTYIDLGNGTLPFYYLEFRNNNSNPTQFYLSLEQDSRVDFTTSNFVPFVACTFYNNSTWVGGYVSKNYSASTIAFDTTNKYFTGLYPSSDLDFSSTPICSRLSNNDWYTLPSSYNRFVFSIFWQYKPVGITSEDFNEQLNQAYEDGYDNGYKIGASNSTSYQEGYDVGHTDGYQAGQLQGFTEGQSRGYEDGYAYGYEIGYDEGVNDSNTYTFGNLFKSIVDTPIWFLQSLFGFSLFGEGETLIGIITSLITVLIVIALIKKVF